MKKALIIANMLFASATVFGAGLDPAELQKATEKLRLVSIAPRRTMSKKAFQRRVYQLQQTNKAKFQAELQKATEKFEIMSIGSQKDKEDFLAQSNTKQVKIESEGFLSTFISEKQPYDRKPEELPVSVLVNSGEHTLQSLHMVRNQDIYTFVQRDHGSSLNGLCNQCPILALGVDENTAKRLQQLYVIVGSEEKTKEDGTKIIIEYIAYVGENGNLEGAMSLGEYMQPRGGLSSDQAVIWEKMAEKLGCRVDIFEFPNQGTDAMGFYHEGGRLSMISSYGTQFKKVKRLNLHSGGDSGHYTELRVFNKDGSQVE